MRSPPLLLLLLLLHLLLPPAWCYASSSSGSAPRGLPRGRPVGRVERGVRLPVWPVAQGVALTLLDWVGLRGLAARLEDAIGGRVCPMTFQEGGGDPFLMLVHHRHSFFPLDPLRALTKFLLPEGFPAHPHRGFATCTIMLQGRLLHRDSLGVKQVYGPGTVQWLHAGNGILHEEMFVLPPFERTDVELYQIWVNVPSYSKATEPIVQLLSVEDSTLKETRLPGGGLVSIYAGLAEGKETHWKGMASELSVLRVQLSAGETWSHALPADHTCMGYIRRESLSILQDEASPPPEASVASQHELVWWDQNEGDCISLSAGNEGLDVLILHGKPLKEPVAASGPFVLNTQSELQRAYRDYEAGAFGVPWSHESSDQEWLEGLRQKK